LGNNQKMGYDSCPPLYNAYGAKILRSKFCKKKKRERKRSHYLKQPAPSKKNWSVFTGELPTHSHLPWSIFMGDLPTHIQSGLFSRATSPHTHAYPGLFSWATCPSRKRKSSLIVMGDLLRYIYIYI